MTDLPANLRSPFGHKTMIAPGALVVVFAWSNSCILGSGKNKAPQGSTALSADYVYHGMARALEGERPRQLVTKPALAAKTHSFRRLSEQACLPQRRTAADHPKLDRKDGLRTR